MEDLTGRQFGYYQIVAPLGEGGMAAVYKAYQPSMERFVAVKVLPRHMATSEEFLSRFKREARLLAQLQHPHILPVFDYGEAEGYPYIVMPFINSGTLGEFIKRQTLSLPEVRRIMVQIGEALSYAHARGMIHRDIKPSNVLIDERGNCLLTDFGLARMTEASTKITTSGAIMGTPAYMSPEQGAGSNIDHRSDIYSLGIILYEMVTGRVPYTAETPIAIVFKHIQDPLPSPRKLKPGLSEAVELVLLKTLAKNPDDRFQTADEFVRAIIRAIPETSLEDKDSSSQITKTEIVSSRPAADTPQVETAIPSAKIMAAEENGIANEKTGGEIEVQPASTSLKKSARNLINTRSKKLIIALSLVFIILVAVIGLAKSYGILVTDSPAITSTNAYGISNLSTTTSRDDYYTTTSFTKGQDVYLTFDLGYTPIGTSFESRWYYQVNILGKDVYLRFTTLTYTSESGDNQIYFYMNKPGMTGFYRVDVYRNEYLIGTRYFSVE